MNKPLLLGLLLLAASASAQTPISINQNDMPDVGDTLRVSRATPSPALNFQSTGANHTWNFANLVPIAQQVERFVSVSSTGGTYQLFFNNQFLAPGTYSSIASPAVLPAQIAGMGVTDPYGFYRETSTQFRQTGWGGSVNGTAVPVAFNNPDVIYTFPMNYQSTSSSNSDYEINIPGMGYIGHQQTRENMVDGWGTLTTPFGTFQVLRVVSTINATDTIFANGQGMQIQQPLTREYKWLAKNGSTPKMGIPVLQITTQDFGVGEVPTLVQYRDQYRNLGPTSAAGELAANPVSVSPNPFSNEIRIAVPAGVQGQVQLVLFDALGRQVKAATATAGETVWNSSELGSSGMYFLHVRTAAGTSVHKLIRLN